MFNELPGMVPGKMQGNVAILKDLGFTATALLYIPLLSALHHGSVTQLRLPNLSQLDNTLRTFTFNDRHDVTRKDSSLDLNTVRYQSFG